MKPHEEKWSARAGVGAESFYVDTDGALVAVVFTERRKWLVAAAPPMARALMAFLPENGHSMECGNISDDAARCSEECRNARAALKAAGVLHD